MLRALMALIASMIVCEPVSPERPVDGVNRIYEGTYEYEFGDRIRSKCDRPTGCLYSVVRDDTLQGLIESYGKDVGFVRFVGELVDACSDPRSSEFACVTTGRGEAIIIKEWIYHRDMKN